MDQSSQPNNVNNNPVSKQTLICKICQIEIDETSSFIKCQYCEILLHVSCISSYNISEKKYFISVNEWSCIECFHLNIIDDINDVSVDDVNTSFSCNVKREGCLKFLNQNNSSDILADLESNENKCPLEESSPDCIAGNKHPAQHKDIASIDNVSNSENSCFDVENEKTKIRYVSLLKGTKNDKPKVFDSLGYGYFLFQMKENYIKWNCIKRNGRSNCNVFLKQCDGNFEQYYEHNHCVLAEEYITALKNKAIEQSPIVFHLSILKNKIINSHSTKQEVVSGPKQLKRSSVIANKKGLVIKREKYKPSSCKSAYVVFCSDKDDEEPKLVEQTLGFTYRLLKSTDHSKIWICSSAGCSSMCNASVKQIGKRFISLRSNHLHKGKKRKISAIKTKIQGSKLKINSNKCLVSNKLLESSGERKGQKIRTSQRIHQNLNKASLSFERPSEAQHVDKTTIKNKKRNRSIKEKYSTNSIDDRFTLNEKILPKSKRNREERNALTKPELARNEWKTLGVVSYKEDIIKNNPLSGEHDLAITKLFLDILNTGFPVSQCSKLNTTNLKKNKLFKIFIDGCKDYFDKQNLNIFPERANKPSTLWINQFLQRNMLLSQRLVDTATESYTATSWKKVCWFYSNFERSLKETKRQDPHHYLDINNSHKIFNCDSLVLTINLKNFDEKVHKISQKTMTVLCCVSSSGQSFKPLIINRGKSIAKYASDNEIDGKYNSISSLNGRVDNQIFHEWLLLFDNQLVQLEIQRPVILFLNGIHTYISYHSIQFAANKNIILYFIPPNSSGTLSPLHVSVFPVLKDNFYKRFKKVLIRNKFPIAFIRAYEDINVTELAVEGFKNSGLCPYNETACGNKFTEKDIPAAEYTNLCSSKESVLSLLDSSGKTKNSLQSNNNFAMNIPHGVSQTTSDLDIFHENLPSDNDNKLIGIGISETNQPCEKKELSATNIKDLALSKSNSLISNSNTLLLAKSSAKVEITNGMEAIKGGTFSKFVKDNISTLPDVETSLENKNDLAQQENTLFNTNVADSLVTNKNFKLVKDISNCGNINNDSVIEEKSLKVTSCQNLEQAGESFSVHNVNQILSSSGKIGYQIALENMEEVFKNVIDPEILSLYEKKLALDEDYPDTTYLVWCGLQRLKKMISSESIS